jgi:hypothetical protein
MSSDSSGGGAKLSQSQGTIDRDSGGYANPLKVGIEDTKVKKSNKNFELEKQADELSSIGEDCSE